MTKYAFNKFDEHSVRAQGINLDISLKTAVNICNKVRGLNAEKALAFLDRVLQKKEPVPFTRFTDGVGHRKGMASGRYPQKATIAISKVILSAITNAANQGFAEELKIVHINAQKAGSPLHQGRQRRRVMKRTNIEVVLKESEVKKTSSKEKKGNGDNSADKKKRVASAIKKQDKDDKATQKKVNTDTFSLSVTESREKNVLEESQSTKAKTTIKALEAPTE